MSETNCQRCLKKITVRNFITIATVITFLTLTTYAVLYNTNVLENPLITFLLGTFVSVVTMIYQFYYRKNPSKEKENITKLNDLSDGEFDICPCCGQELKKLDS